MATLARVVGVVFVAVVAAVVVVAMADDDPEAAQAPQATAPIAPPGVPARPAPPASDQPGEGVEAEEARTVQLGLPTPREFRPASPERAVAHFRDAWHDRAWDRMALWTSAPWRKRQRDAGAELRDRFAAYRVRGWTIEDTSRTGPTAIVTVLMARRDLKPQITRERRRFALVRPEGGRWGVLPLPD